MKCRGCGVKLPRDASYCYNCGLRVVRRRGLLKAILPGLLLAVALSLLVVGPSLNAFKPKASDAEQLAAEGFRTTLTWDGYIVVHLDRPSLADLILLENALQKVGDIRRVILTNNVQHPEDRGRGPVLSDVARGVEGVEGVWYYNGTLTVSVSRPTASQLYSLFNLAGDEVQLYVRFLELS
ncbi:MAG: hypothetical protein QXD32_02050 [Nitrososphaerota archaeon]